MMIKPQDYYWRTIDLPNFLTIQKKTQNFIENHTSLLNRALFDGNVYQIQYSEQIIKEVPELTQDFLTLNLNILACALFVAWPDLDTHIPHIDHLTLNNRARINLPIFNCAQTYTAFYTNYTAEERRLANGEYYSVITNKDYIETTRVELTQPTLLRISEPHAILVNQARKYPRITLTVKCNPDAVTLFG